MIYIKEIPSQNIEDALALNSDRADKIRLCIGLAYQSSWHKEGPNVDQINAFVAPELRTAEEAFYACSVIMTDVFGAMLDGKKKKK
jgi:hypothetical protein